MEPSEIIARAETAGVSLHRRPMGELLSRRLETVIANGLETEPLLAADRTVMIRYATLVLEGLTRVLEATRAARGILAVPASDAAVMKAMTRARKQAAHVEVFPVEEFYPAGDPVVLAAELLNLRVPPGMPLEASGVTVVGIHPLWHLASATRGQPVTHRFVTVVGEVKKPVTLRVPLGLPFADLIALRGGLTEVEQVVLIEGGPLTGRLATPETAVGPETAALLVLPADHEGVMRLEADADTQVRRAMSACAACRMCTDRCPQALLGYPIEPHLLMRAVSHGLDTIPEVVTGAGSCRSCRLCEVVCPAGLTPGRFYGIVSDSLASRGGGGLPSRGLRPPLEEAAERRASKEWLTRRLGVAAYDREWPVDDNYLAVPRVTLSLEGAMPCVEVGQRVALGDVVAQPKSGGLRVHSPIAGVVNRMDPFGASPRMIELCSE